jgi:predicted naringenin-chalcone synthase
LTAVEERTRRAHIQSRERAWGHMGRSLGPHIAGLAVADSDTVLSQRDVLDRLGLSGDEFAEGVFARCGVERRHLHLPPEFLALNLQGRSEQVEEQLFTRSVQAIEQLEVDPRSIGTIVSSSLYSLGCPTLAHRLVEHYGMDPATDKYHLTGVGCASAVPLLRLATQSLQRRHRKPVLVVAAESMSSILMRAQEDDPRAKTVGSAIFGDGCAAALLSNDSSAGGPVIRATQVHQIAGSIDAVSLAMGAEQSYLHLARELPDLAAAELDQLVAGFLAPRNLDRGAIDHWIVHPGGRRIVEGVRDALGLDDEDVGASWRALADHGNVGTPSIFYVLRSTIDERSPGPGELGLAVTIGPGVTVGLMLLQW